MIRLPNGLICALACFALALSVVMPAVLGGDAAGVAKDPLRSVLANQPYRITHLAYNTNGPMIAPEAFRQQVQTLFYGAPITNLVFRTELPPRDAVPPPEPATVGPSVPQTLDQAPPRPDRPSFSLDWRGRDRGLPGSKVNCLLQTRDGYLWMGTPEGLARFDGSRFTVFNESNSPMMLSEGAKPQVLFEDGQGQLWIGTERGVLLFANGQFVRFPGQASLRQGSYSCIRARSAGGLWLASDQGLFHFADGELVNYPEIIGVHRSPVGELFEQDSGTLWFGSQEGLYRLDPMTREVSLPLIRHVAGHWWRFHRDRQNRLWIGAANGVWRWENGTLREIHTELNPALAGIPALQNPCFAEDRLGRVWASSAPGDSLVRFGTNDATVEGFALGSGSVAVQSMAMDREDTLWLGTERHGLGQFEIRPFSTFSIGQFPHSQGVHTVTEARDGAIWAGVGDGFFRWSGRDVCFFEFRTRDNVDTSGPVLATPSGRVWGAYPFGGILMLPINDQDPWMQLTGNLRHRSAGVVRVMYRTRDGGFWMGGRDGLHRIVSDITLQTLRTPVLANNDIRSLMEDRSGRLWVGSMGGLDCLDEKSPTRWTGRDGLPAEEVDALLCDTDGDMWIGTQRGLCLIQSGKLSVFGADSGVPQGAIRQILEDDTHRLWIRDSRGFACVARSELKEWAQHAARVPAVSELGRDDGIRDPESLGKVQHPAGTRASDGRLWFPTRGGLAVVDPVDWGSPPRPTVLIEQVSANEQVLLGDGSTNLWTPGMTPIRLAAGKADNVTFRFTCSSLRRPDQVRLLYRLEGQDTDWRESGPARMATYNNLKPGRYQFRVKAAIRSGVWSEREAELSFVYPPVLWRTWPFLAFCGVSMVSLVGGMTVWALKRQRRELQMEQAHALDFERARIARDMHDQLGGDLSRMVLRAGENELAQTHVREAVDGLNAMIWAVKPTNDTLCGLVDFVSNCAHQHLGAAGMALDLDIPSDLPSMTISSKLRYELAGAFKETLRNIVQHSGAKRVSISLRLYPTRLAIEVTDDGCGFNPAEVHGRRSRSSGGKGLVNLRQRLENLGGVCEVDSAPGRGTCIEFRVPLAAKEQ